jgi:hypothetical protein
LERNKNYIIKNRFFGLRGEEEYFDGLLRVIEIDSDEAIWDLVLNTNYETIDGAPAYFEAWIADGVRMITISPVFDFKNPGKSKLLESLIDAEIWPKGFEFMEGNQSIDAIQITRWAGQFVWFSKENDPMTNFVLGASYTALLPVDLYNRLPFCWIGC